MNIKFVSCGLLTAALAVAGATGCASQKQEQARLQAQAKISQSQAEQIALAKVPNGTVKEADIEKEHGKLIWSFDIATPGSQNITEVAVDALSGEIVAVDEETPEQQASEKD